MSALIVTPQSVPGRLAGDHRAHHRHDGGQQQVEAQPPTPPERERQHEERERPQGHDRVRQAPDQAHDGRQRVEDGCQGRVGVRRAGGDEGERRQQQDRGDDEENVGGAPHALGRRRRRPDANEIAPAEPCRACHVLSLPALGLRRGAE